MRYVALARAIALAYLQDLREDRLAVFMGGVMAGALSVGALIWLGSAVASLLGWVPR